MSVDQVKTRKVLTSTLFESDVELDAILSDSKIWYGLKACEQAECIRKIHAALIIVCKHLFHENAPENSNHFTFDSSQPNKPVNELITESHKGNQKAYEEYVNEVRAQYDASMLLINDSKNAFANTITKSSEKLIKIFQKGYTAYYNAKKLRLDDERDSEHPKFTGKGYLEPNITKNLLKIDGTGDGLIGPATIIALDEELNNIRHYTVEPGNERNPTVFFNESRSVQTGFTSVISKNIEARGINVTSFTGNGIIYPKVGIITIWGNHVESLNYVKEVRLKNATLKQKGPDDSEVNLDGLYTLMGYKKDDLNTPPVPFPNRRNCYYDKINNITSIYVALTPEQDFYSGLLESADFTVEYNPKVYSRNRTGNFPFQDGITGDDPTVIRVNGNCVVSHIVEDFRTELYLDGNHESGLTQGKGLTIHTLNPYSDTLTGLLHSNSTYYASTTVTIQGQTKTLKNVTKVDLFTDGSWVPGGHTFKASYVKPDTKSFGNQAFGAAIKEASSYPDCDYFVYLRGNWTEVIESLPSTGDDSKIEMYSDGYQQNDRVLELLPVSENSLKIAEYHDYIDGLHHVTKLKAKTPKPPKSLKPFWNDCNFQVVFGKPQEKVGIDSGYMLEHATQLEFNDKVFVKNIFSKYWEDEDGMYRGGDWCYIQELGHRIHLEDLHQNNNLNEFSSHGFIRFSELWTNSKMPDVTANLYRIEQGDNLYNIIKKHYLKDEQDVANKRIAKYAIIEAKFRENGKHDIADRYLELQISAEKFANVDENAKAFLTPRNSNEAYEEYGGLRFLANALLYANNPTGKRDKTYYSLNKETGKFDQIMSQIPGMHFIDGERSRWDFFKEIDLETASHIHHNVRPNTSYLEAPYYCHYDDWEDDLVMHQYNFGDAGMVRTDWRQVKLIEGRHIWLPSIESLLALRNTVSTGEISAGFMTEWTPSQVAKFHKDTAIEVLAELLGDLLVEVFPENKGVEISGNIGASAPIWGIPLSAGLNSKFVLWREDKVKDGKKTVHFKFSRKGFISGALDVGVGWGGWMGNGAKQKGKTNADQYGTFAGLEAGLQAGVKIYVEEEYDFPIEENNCLANIVISILKGIKNTILKPHTFATHFLSQLANFNEDAGQYKEKLSFGIGFFGEGSAKAGVSFRIGTPKKGDEKQVDYWKINWYKKGENPDFGKLVTAFSGQGILSLLSTILPEGKLGGSTEALSKISIEFSDRTYDVKTGYRFPAKVKVQLLGELSAGIQAGIAVRPVFGFQFDKGISTAIGIKDTFEINFDQTGKIDIDDLEIKKLSSLKTHLNFTIGESGNPGGPGNTWEIGFNVPKVVDLIKKIYNNKDKIIANASGIFQFPSGIPLPDSANLNLTNPLWFLFALKSIINTKLIIDSLVDEIKEEDIINCITEVTFSRKIDTYGIFPVLNMNSDAPIGASNNRMPFSDFMMKISGGKFSFDPKELASPAGLELSEMLLGISSTGTFAFKAEPKEFISALATYSKKMMSEIVTEANKQMDYSSVMRYIFLVPLSSAGKILKTHETQYESLLSVFKIEKMELESSVSLGAGFGFEVALGVKVAVSVGGALAVFYKESIENPYEIRRRILQGFDDSPINEINESNPLLYRMLRNCGIDHKRYTQAQGVYTPDVHKEIQIV